MSPEEAVEIILEAEVKHQPVTCRGHPTKCERNAVFLIDGSTLDCRND